MADAVSPELLARSRQSSLEYFTDPNSYGELSHTRSHKKIVECIEPKNRKGFRHGEFKTVLQTGGGAAGLAVDRSVTSSVLSGTAEKLTMSMDRNQEAWPFKVAGAHRGCAFIGSRALILGEMVEPGPFTLARAREWADYFGVRDRMEDQLESVSLGARAVLELTQAAPESEAELLAHADELYRGYNNVGDVEGLSLSNIYAIGLHPYIGQNRNQKDPNDANIIQGYHASIGANRTHLAVSSVDTGDEHGLLDTTMLVREAATCTVISSGRPDMTFLDIRPAETRRGYEIVERDFSQYLIAT